MSLRSFPRPVLWSLWQFLLARLRHRPVSNAGFQVILNPSCRPGFCKQPMITRIPKHSTQFVFSRNLIPRKRQHDKPGRSNSHFYISLVPDSDPSSAEGFLFEIFASDRLNREALSFNRQSPLSMPARRLFQQRPGAQDSFLNNAQVEVRSAGFVLMDHKF
jgi:hypothetical protein